MVKRITTEDILNDKNFFTEKEADEIRKNVQKEVEKYKWGGARKNSGRKTIDESKVLKFTKRLSEKEALFIDYARAHNINYDDLMQG